MKMMGFHDPAGLDSFFTVLANRLQIMSASANITATVTGFDRIDQTINTIGRILACDPRPAEILVHVDANRTACATALGRAFPDLKILLSIKPVGPGGGRNKLAAAAKYPIVANFDDDSYPLDDNYFERALKIFEWFPDASVVGAQIYHRGEPIADARQVAKQTDSFIGCGVVFRRDDILDVGGYLPLSIAYGAEEVDIALRLFDKGKRIYTTRWLRVFHDTDLRHHANAELNAASIANCGLVAYLRYPPRLWLFGAMQVMNRVFWCIRVRRFRGILRGLWTLPGLILAHREQRKPISIVAFKTRREQRRAAQEITFGR
jgi:GT2 family glycosyltransferase